MVKGEKSEGEQKTCILSLGKKKKETVNTEPSVWSSEEAILQYCLKNCLQRQISILPKHCTTNHIYTLHNKNLQQKRKTIYKINEYKKKYGMYSVKHCRLRRLNRKKMKEFFTQWCVVRPGHSPTLFNICINQYWWCYKIFSSQQHSKCLVTY